MTPALRLHHAAWSLLVECDGRGRQTFVVMLAAAGGTGEMKSGALQNAIAMKNPRLLTPGVNRARSATHLARSTPAGAQPLPPFTLERYFAKYEFHARHLLCCSDPEPHTMRELLTGADEDSLQRWTELRLGYTETQGLPALRDAISERYTRVGPDEVVVLAPEEGIFLTMQAALRPGQHVIVTYPGYQSLYDVARSIGCTVSFWRPRTEPSGELRFVVDDLEELVHQGPKPALVATNWPHNPTGATLREEDLRRVAALVGDAGALLFCDEMYRTLEHDPGTRPTAGADVGPHVVSLSGLSKTLGMPGLRIGWLAVRDAALRQRILELKDFTTICNSCASEVLALMALRRHDAILAEKLAIVRANLDLLDRFFDKYRDHFAWVRPPASTVAFPKLTSAALGPRGIDDFCSRLVEASGVLLLPASVYGDAEFTDARHFRIGYGRQSMPVALEAFEAHLRSVL